MTMTTQQTQGSADAYAIIGAGPMGLVMARELQRLSIPFQGFELHSGPGGLWDIDNPHSTMYESAHLISSKTMTELKEFPMRDEVATYPKHTEVGTYFRDYAENFNLNEHYHYQARVLKTEKQAEGKWRVQWRSEVTGEVHEAQFKGVLIATGTLHYPNMPQAPEGFTGEVMHAGAYRQPESFRDQRVLIVGCGNSACDIAVDAVHHAKSVGLSVRRGYYFLPKFVFGKAIDTLGGAVKLPNKLKQWVDGFIVRALVGKPSKYGLPDPDYRLYESHPVMNSLVLHHLGHGDIQPHGDIVQAQGKRITFSNGSEAEYDKIVYATGYKLHFPFIDKSLLNWQGPAPDLYLNVFHPEDPSLCMLGMIEATGLGWQGRADQARLVALYLKSQAEAKGPEPTFSSAIAKNQNDFSGGIRYLKLDRMAYYVNKEEYRAAIAKYTRTLERHLGV